VKDDGDDEGSCGFNIDSNLECIYFQVQGRKTEDDRKKEGDYVVILIIQTKIFFEIIDLNFNLFNIIDLLFDFVFSLCQR
jgi:hypothetical protein